MIGRVFKTEAELCQAFMDTVPKTWTVYPETGGFDMLLVHAQGFQLGIEAKLQLNPKVVVQAADTGARRGLRAGPDARAVLVPKAHNRELAKICRLLAITIVCIERGPSGFRIWPPLPKPDRLTGSDGDLDVINNRVWASRDWFDLCPIEQVTLPEYVPDVLAGVPHPVILGRWKIQAMKVCVWVEKRGAITRAHFKALDIDPGRWMTGYWLEKSEVRGEWRAGPAFPFKQFEAQHPTILAKVIEDYEKWAVSTGLSTLPPLKCEAAR